MHKFSELKVYQKALAFTKTVRKTTKSFPKDELFGLSAQFRRAADSIVMKSSQCLTACRKVYIAHKLYLATHLLNDLNTSL